jgi:hypothetical protein
MNAIKWAQLICSLILILLPAAIEYRNWKHHDKRTKLHRWITGGLLILWISSAAGISWAMYRDISRIDKLPAFAFYLNNSRCNPGKVFTFPLTNTVQHLQLAVQNVGNFPADTLIFFLEIRKEFVMPISPGWDESQKAPTNSGDGIVFSESNTRYLSANMGHALLPEGDFFVCPTLNIQWTNIQPVTFNLNISAVGKNFTRQGFSILVQLR